MQKAKKNIYRVGATSLAVKANSGTHCKPGRPHLALANADPSSPLTPSHLSPQWALVVKRTLTPKKNYTSNPNPQIPNYTHNRPPPILHHSIEDRNNTPAHEGCVGIWLIFDKKLEIHVDLKH